MKLRLLFCVLLLCLCFKALATHIVGGELSLQQRAGYNYRIILNLYFDDIHGDPNRKDAVARIGIFEKGTNRSIKALSLPLRGEEAINYTNVGCTTSDLKTLKLIYYEDIYLDPAIYNSPNGYYIASEICCRNPPISNIVTPGDAGTTFYIEFPAVIRNGVQFNNSSPTLSPPPSDYACVGELFYYDFSSTDADGDELVYDLVTPLNGHSVPGKDAVPPASPAPYPEIQWLPGYNAGKQIQGNPDLAIDRTTGRLTVRPASLGLFVFGVRCQEFRNGVKIGEVRRDFQLLVKNCHRNESPQVSAILPGSTQPYQEGQIVRISSKDPRCIKVLFTDPDPGEPLSLAAKPGNFNNNFFSLSGTVSGVVNTGNQDEALEATLCLEPCFDTEGGVYLLNLIVSDEGDNGCSLPRQDTLQLSLVVEPLPNNPPSIALSTSKRIMEVSEGDVIRFDVTGTDLDDEEITVSATGKGFDINSQNITFETKSGLGLVTVPFTWQIDCEAPKQHAYQIEFAVTSNSCGKQTIKTETIDVITRRYDIGNNQISGNQVVCYGESPTALTGSVPTGGRGTFNYTWEMSTDQKNFTAAPGVSNQQTYTPPTLDKTAWYRRKVVSGNCDSNTSETVKVIADVLLPTVGEDMTIIQGSYATLSAKGGQKYAWSPATGLSDPTSSNPVAKPQQTTTYTVTITSPYGCIYTDEVTVTVLPRIAPTNALTVNGDGANDTWAIRNIEYYPNCRVQVFTKWGARIFDSRGYDQPWDGTHNGSPLPMAAYYFLIDLGMGTEPVAGSVTLIK
ncbi:gliding motility-associated C-terminal domain-containing protein [Pontibacter sp. MBLB2868]|uniref:gliding motility-associated C-terminal domain-containing protein n=1 Tax=Pontibacter sp. MBLB2868 TaxID=3451555 RepID=UPI003F7540AA